MRRKGTARRITHIAIAVALVFFLCCGAAYAFKGLVGARDEHGHGHRGRLLRAHIGRMITLEAELDLTEAQIAQIRQIVENEKERIRPLVRKTVEKKRALRDAVLAEPSDEKAIRRAADELGDVVADVSVLASEIVAKVRPVLTKEQIELLGEFLEDHDSSVDRCRWLKDTVE